MIPNTCKNDINTYLTICDLSHYLAIKEKTLYAKVAAGLIPHFKIGHLVRFRKSDIDDWMESQKVIPVDYARKATDIFRPVKMKSVHIDRIVRKSIDEVRRSAYISSHGKPDHDVKGLGKEVI
jgi:excisionase family DNA binding protein